jgi:hypothetical protein
MPANRFSSLSRSAPSSALGRCVVVTVPSCQRAAHRPYRPAAVTRGTALTPDTGEFTGVRWWSAAEVAAAGPAGFDPHLGRFLAKLGA